MRQRDSAMLARVRRQPCLICLRPGAHAHHLLTAEPSAMGLKSGDNHAVPLCPDHHRQLHAAGNEPLWWSMQGVDPLIWLEAFHRA